MRTKYLKTSYRVKNKEEKNLFVNNLAFATLKYTRQIESYSFGYIQVVSKKALNRAKKGIIKLERDDEAYCFINNDYSDRIASDYISVSDIKKENLYNFLEKLKYEEYIAEKKFFCAFNKKKRYFFPVIKYTLKDYIAIRYDNIIYYLHNPPSDCFANNKYIIELN